jgi:hypothetical protein
MKNLSHTNQNWTITTCLLPNQVQYFYLDGFADSAKKMVYPLMTSHFLKYDVKTPLYLNAQLCM